MLEKSTLKNVSTGAAALAAIIPRALLAALVGILAGAAFGLAFRLLLRRFTPLAPSTIGFLILVGAVAFGLLAFIRGLRRALFGLADRAVEGSLVPLLRRIGTEPESAASKKVILLSEIEKETQQLMAILGPKGSEFILLRWIRQVGASAAEAAGQRLLSTCREVARPGAEGKMEVDLVEVTGQVLMGRAKNAAREVVAGAFRVPLLVISVVAVSLFVVVLI